MKKAIYLAALFGIIGISFIGLEKFNSNPVFYDKNGQCTSNQIKIWGDTVVPTTANGYTIDYSTAGFSSIRKVSITPQLNTATVGSMPLVIIKSYTNSSCIVNILTQNSSTVTILGISVLSGAPLQFAASTTGIILHVQVTGY